MDMMPESVEPETAMVTIVDYRAGNLTSVRLAFESLGVPAQITSDPVRIRSAERVVFPGVGAACAAMVNLAELELGQVLRDVVERGVPFLGICLGTQIVLDRSEEDGGVNCLGLVSGEVKRFQPEDPFDKVPQMGWNSVAIRRKHPVMAGIEDESEFYFVHSFYPTVSDPADIIGTTAYAGAEFVSVLGKDNLVATQFHPEKSGRVGLKLLENFCNWIT